MEEKRRQSISQKIVNIATIIVSVFLLIGIIYILLLSPLNGGFSSVGGNVIQTPEGEMIVIDGIEESETVRFSANNLFPGDSVSKSYKVKVTDKGVKAVSFQALLESQDKSLANVLWFSVSANDEETPIYNGKVADMPSLRVPVTDGCAIFEITVSLSTSAGNEYQNAMVAVDFNWWVAEADYDSNAGEGGNAGDGVACCRCCRHIYLCLVCLLLLLLVLVLLHLMWFVIYITRNLRKKEEPTDKQEEEELPEETEDRTDAEVQDDGGQQSEG